MTSFALSLSPIFASSSIVADSHPSTQVDLQLYENALGREAAHALETVLAQPMGRVVLATLNLSSNKLGDAGCKVCRRVPANIDRPAN